MEGQHKRSKSGIARTLLHRVSSRGDVKTSTPSTPTEPMPDLPSTASTSARPSVDVTGMPETVPPRQSTQLPVRNASGQATIEQSVRLFRVYEALRNGDTAAISKAIRENSPSEGESALDGTTILHLAVQCADVPVVEYILSDSSEAVDINARDKDGNTPLQVAASLNRAPVVRVLLKKKGINGFITNYQGKTALDLAKNPEVYELLQLARSTFIDAQTQRIRQLVAAGDYKSIEQLFEDPHFQSAVDVNSPELATETTTSESGGTLLHEAARKKDTKMIELLLLNGADPFQRDRRGKLPQDVTKDDKTRAMLKKSPAAEAAQRGIQEKTILGAGGPSAVSVGATGLDSPLAPKESREMKGYLKKWTHYPSGYKLRWFVLEDGVLSYYKHQDDAGSACRGAVNMKIAQLHMDAQDKLRFEIHGKSMPTYFLKANHQVEAKRWFWALNNAIQFAKDEARAQAKRSGPSFDLRRQATDPEKRAAASIAEKSSRSLFPETALGIHRASRDDDEAGSSTLGDQSVNGDDISRAVRSNATTAIEGDIDDLDEDGDDASSAEAKPVNRDAFTIAAHSARLQLDLLAQITSALQSKQTSSPTTTIADPMIAQAISSYESAVSNLKGLVGDLGRIARDRETYWQYRVEQESNVRRVWEDNMAKIAKDQEELERQIGESEEKRKRTKRALRDVLEGQTPSASGILPPPRVQISGDVPESAVASPLDTDSTLDRPATRRRASSGFRRKSTMAEIADLSESEDDDDEFFDAVGAGEVEVVDDLPTTSAPIAPVKSKEEDVIAVRRADIQTSEVGYEDAIRKRLKLDADDRPKISLWGILKSMIGKDMTKMTLPVSFNEPTSLLQRVAEDMEYTDLIEEALTRADSTERMVYVAAFAASEYASTIGRVAKPFNPLLGETYEYVRPDKGYRFFIEQVSHHPPIGAAWAEAPRWEYYGESAVKSKFYGKSFDINPLGTWFLRLRPLDGSPEELYTWKKVTSSVIGIITGNPTVDNYGPMEIRNWTTGEVCTLDFKPRGWKASSAYQMSGKVLDNKGVPRWSMGGRWNDKIYARLTPGYEADVSAGGGKDPTNQAFLVWEAHSRPTGIPFNLTPFVVTLNALTDKLRPQLPPTDTRLRPDQRAMEDGEYDFAATEKNRVEEKQRAKRREREAVGEEFIPKWFKKNKDPVTGEEFWEVLREPGNRVKYWNKREKHDWTECEDIF